MTRYGDHHRLFLQFLMNRGIIPASGAKAIISRMTDETEVTDENVGEFVRVINNSLAANHLNMQIRFGFGEASTELEKGQMLVLVNRSKSQNIDHPATSPFEPSETEFFKAMVREMVSSDDGHLARLRCLHLASSSDSGPSTSQATQSSAPRMKIATAERFLNKLLRMGWIVEDRDGLTLGCRAILELEPSLRETYNTPDCSVCRGLVFIPKQQQCPSCDQRFHQRCLRQGAGVLRCPNERCAAVL